MLSYFSPLRTTGTRRGQNHQARLDDGMTEPSRGAIFRTITVRVATCPPVVLTNCKLWYFIGGMDLYNRAFVSNPTHDDFYTNPDIINAFKNYISHVVKRYANNSAVLGWELANDPRCSSTLQGSSSCNTKTITTWVNDIGKSHLIVVTCQLLSAFAAGHIKNLDSNHLITAGLIQSPRT